MTNWTTGEGNPRYWALKLMLHYFAPGDRVVETSLTHDHIYVQARITHEGEKAIVLVNKSAQRQTLVLPKYFTNNATVNVVDGSTNDLPWKSFDLESTSLTLKPFAVSVIELRANVGILSGQKGEVDKLY
jgi:hypothetical protein